MDYTMIEVKKIGVPEYHFVDNLGNIIYKMKRKAISFEDKYIIFDCTDVKIGELNAKPFKHGIFEFIYNNECIDYVLKTFENFTYCLEKKGWIFSPKVNFNKYDVFNNDKLLIEVEWSFSLKTEKYNVKIYDKDNLYLSALVVLCIILLNHWRK